MPAAPEQQTKHPEPADNDADGAGGESVHFCVRGEKNSADMDADPIVGVVNPVLFDSTDAFEIGAATVPSGGALAIETVHFQGGDSTPESAEDVLARYPTGEALDRFCRAAVAPPYDSLDLTSADPRADADAIEFALVERGHDVVRRGRAVVIPVTGRSRPMAWVGEEHMYIAGIGSLTRRLSDAYSEIAALRREMDAWRDLLLDTVLDGRLDPNLRTEVIGRARRL